MATLAIVFTVVIHTLGIPVMIWAVRGDEGMKGLFDWVPRDEPGDGGTPVTDDPQTSPSGGGDALPLPTSEQARTRLREHGDRVANPARQPRRRRQPAPAEPVREPDRTHIGS